MITRHVFQTKIAIKVKKLRTEAKLSQQELAKRSDVARTSITQLEGNDFMPTLYFAYKLASAFGITIDELIR